LPITGQLWAIEVKTETGERRDSQLETLPLIEASGGLVTVARDTLVIRDIINAHYSRFSADEIEAHRRKVRELRDAAARREVERAIAKRAAETKRQTKRLNKAVDSAESPTLFE
jgi:hypothetical protein